MRYLIATVLALTLTAEVPAADNFGNLVQRVGSVLGVQRRQARREARSKSTGTCATTTKNAPVMPQ